VSAQGQCGQRKARLRKWHAVDREIPVDGSKWATAMSRSAGHHETSRYIDQKAPSVETRSGVVTPRLAARPTLDGAVTSPACGARGKSEEYDDDVPLPVAKTTGKRLRSRPLIGSCWRIGTT